MMPILSVGKSLSMAGAAGGVGRWGGLREVADSSPGGAMPVVDVASGG